MPPEQETVSVQRPDDNARCSDCTHTFGVHFVSADGKVFGCSVKESVRSPSSRMYACVCSGFAVRVIWGPKQAGGVVRPLASLPQPSRA